MSKDWDGNKKSTFVTLAASSHSQGEREANDYYATEPKALRVLFDEGKVKLKDPVLEPSCGEGHLSEVLKEYGYNVTSRDLIDRGYGEVADFLETQEQWDGTIITNPPYKYAQAFVEHALDIVAEGNSVFMFLKLQFLEGKGRKKLFQRKELKTVYVSSSRLKCAINGDFSKVSSSAVAYAWFEFVKGYNGDPVIKWIN